MTLRQFAAQSGMDGKLEIEKVELLAFYHLEREQVAQFTMSDVVRWCKLRSYSEPNLTRLQKKLRMSRSFIRGDRDGSFRLHARTIERRRAQFPELSLKSEAVISSDTILPESLYINTRGFVESLARQINASYEHNIFDGCAVLMRRLLEVLLILSYQHLKIESAIQNQNGDFVMLERIVADAETNKVLSLSRNSRGLLDVFRTVGNFSAHKIYYNAKRNDLHRYIVEYRALIEELLYKSGLKQ